MQKLLIVPCCSNPEVDIDHHNNTKKLFSLGLCFTISLVMVFGPVFSSSSFNLLNNAFADDMMGGAPTDGGDDNQDGDSDDTDHNGDDGSNSIPQTGLTTDTLTAGSDDDDDDDEDSGRDNDDEDDDDNRDEPTAKDAPVTASTLTAQRIECPPGQEYYLFSTSCEPVETAGPPRVNSGDNPPAAGPEESVTNTQPDSTGVGHTIKIGASGLFGVGTIALVYLSGGGSIVLHDTDPSYKSPYKDAFLSGIKIGQRLVNMVAGGGDGDGGSGDSPSEPSSTISSSGDGDGGSGDQLPTQPITSVAGTSGGDSSGGGSGGETTSNLPVPAGPDPTTTTEPATITSQPSNPEPLLLPQSTLPDPPAGLLPSRPVVPIDNLPKLDVKNQAGNVVKQLTPEEVQSGVQTTKDLIERNGPFPHPDNDGVTFNNNLGKLPEVPNNPNYYKEYTVPTPDINNRGPQRIVVGQQGEMYYTSDHYKTFTRIK